MLQVRIRVFRSTDDIDSSIKFVNGHRAVLQSIGVDEVVSKNQDWIYNPNVYVIIAESPDSKNVYGGAKIQIKDDMHLLPIEEAIGGIDSAIYKVVNDYQKNMTGEFCGLWNSREVIAKGLGSIFLVRVGVARVGVAVAKDLNINSLFSLCASYTYPIAQRVGFEIEKSLGDNGYFNYPTTDMRAIVAILKDPKTLHIARTNEREFIFNLRNNPNLKKVELGPKGSTQIEYDLAIHI